MPLALSGGVNVWGMFPSSRPDTWAASVYRFLCKAGWVDNGPLTGGYLVKGTSPQGHEVEAKIYTVLDGGGAHNRGAIQFRNTADPSIVSGIKYFDCPAGRIAGIVANRCQFFIYTPGVSADQWGTVIAGGCGYTAGTALCHGAVVNDTVTEAWWIVGDGRTGDSSVIYNTPRTTLLNYGQPDVLLGAAGLITNSDGCINGIVRLGGVRFITLTPITPDGSTKFLSHSLWAGEIPMKLEPLVAWAPPSLTNPVRIWMQLYDARIKTTPGVPMDTVSTEDGYTWLDFSNSYYFGNLQLMVTEPAPEPFPMHFTH